MSLEKNKKKNTRGTDFLEEKVVRKSNFTNLLYFDKKEILAWELFLGIIFDTSPDQTESIESVVWSTLGHDRSQKTKFSSWFYESGSRALWKFRSLLNNNLPNQNYLLL